MECVYCKENLEENQLFCPKCGKRHYRYDEDSSYSGNSIIDVVALSPSISILLYLYKGIGALYVVSSIMILLCCYDYIKLSNKGYDTRKQWIGLLFFLPLYVFRREKLLKHSSMRVFNIYMFLTILCLLVSLFL